MSTGTREDLESDIRRRFDEGDYEGAATLALRGYGPEIYAFLTTSLHGADADEAFSMFAEGLWRAFPKFEWRSSLRTLAYAVARRTSLHYRRQVRRQARRQEPLPDDSAVMRVAAEVRTSTSMRFVKTERRSRIAELREALAPDDRELLILRVDRELAWMDLAHVLRGEDEAPLEGDALKREAARLRKRFQHIKTRLREMARKEGLLDEPE